MILPFKNKQPILNKTAFIAPGAHVIGDVRLEADASIWFGAVLRGDMGAIRIGRRTNVQDGAVLHGDHGLAVRIGDDVTIGHQATVHACTVKSRCLIGIGARILTGAVIGENSLVGAGSLVLEGVKIPAGSLVLGAPARVVRRLSALEIRGLKQQALRYAQYARHYRKFLG